MHEFAEHVAAVNVPKEQELVPDTVYPELHVGWHVEPLASELVQSPAPPFDGVVDASHGFGEHTTASSRVPSKHDLVPDILCPMLHVGWQRSPESTVSSHVPLPPFSGGDDASHDR